MKSRSKARARVLQVLYAWEMRGATSQLSSVDSELTEPASALGGEATEYAALIMGHFEDHRAEIDRQLEALSENWRLERMTVIDRNILRVAATEMLYCDDVPLRVSVHEAIKLAELFGTAESRRFVNGVLDSLMHSLEPENLPDAP